MKKHTQKVSRPLNSKGTLKKHPRQNGFSLIEIMVATLILSLGILGVVSLQVVGLRGTQQSYMKQQAMSVVQNLTERMRSNISGVKASNYVLVDSNSFDCSNLPVCNTNSSQCNPADIATVDLHNVICGYESATGSRTGGVRAVNPTDITAFVDGRLSLSCRNNVCANGDIQINLSWSERAIGKEEVNAQDSLIVKTRVMR